MPVEVKIFDDLDAVAADAAGALDRAAQPSLFDRLSWFQLTRDHCPPPGRPLILRARDGGERAWLFLTVEEGRVAALASWYSLGFGAIGASRLFADLAAALRRQGIAEASLYPIADGDPLPAAFRAAGWRVLAEPASVAWRARTSGLSFDDYWGRRPTRLRNTAERKAEAAGLDVTIRLDFDEAAWAEYEQVYAASWKPAEGSTAFLRALAEREGAAGTLRLGIARHNGTPVAAQLWLVENGIATIHKLAHAEAAKALSPGTLLSMTMFRHALDVDHVRAIDFGLGDDAYKADWMDEKRIVSRLRAFNPATVRGLLGHARARAGALVRRARSS